MSIAPIRVGIVGASGKRGWAKDAHAPALRALPGLTLQAVSARTDEDARAAATALGAARAFGDWRALIEDRDVDLVTVTTRVPEHREIVMAALTERKPVYCEWPLARDAAEAAVLADAVGDTPVAIGLQGLAAPAIRHAAALVAEGRLGRLRQLRVFSATGGWGAQAPLHYAYLQDKRNGATLSTIAGGHTLATAEAVAGALVEVDARETCFTGSVAILGQADAVPRSCADHMLVLGRHASGCLSTIEVVGGDADSPFSLELVGETGRLRITGHHAGGYQLSALRLETSFAAPPPPPPATDLAGPAANVAEAYARFAAQLHDGAPPVPDFRHAVRLSRLLASIARASETGRRQYMENADDNGFGVLHAVQSHRGNG